jgi:hypothetical protein
MINCWLLNRISLLLIWIEEMEADKLTNFIISLSDFILLSWKHKKKWCVLWIFLFFQSNFTMFYTNTSLMTCIKYTNDGELKTIKMAAIVMETTSKFTFSCKAERLNIGQCPVQIYFGRVQMHCGVSCNLIKIKSQNLLPIFILLFTCRASSEI